MTDMILMRITNDQIGTENKCITIFASGKVDGLEGGPWVVINYFPRMIAEAQEKIEKIIIDLRALQADID